MKFFLDANISWRLIKKLQVYYPNSIHVNMSGLLAPQNDDDIWLYAKKNDYTILTFDEDFLSLSLRFGHPPKVVLLKTKNQSSFDVLHLLDSRKNEIEDFYNSVDDSILVFT